MINNNPTSGVYAAENVEQLTARANVYAKRANRAIQAGDLDAAALYTEAEMQVRRTLGDLQEIASEF